jgi:hypothetical protein
MYIVYWDSYVLLDIYCLLELNMLCLNVTRGYGDHRGRGGGRGEEGQPGRFEEAGGLE